MKTDWNTAALIRKDKKHLWHPFTQMQEWCHKDHDPLVITRGEGVYLWDSEGNRYIDGNSSIWCTIHGHNHPKMNRAIEEQLDQIAHCSFLGFTNPKAIELAETLVHLFPKNTLSRVFYSDDGSTAIECALKMAIQYWQLADEPQRCEFITFSNAYHGDTAGAASLGGIATFHKRFQSFGYTTHTFSTVEELLTFQETTTIAAVCIEPLIQSAAGMQTWPQGMLKKIRNWCDQHGIFLILDEVMTGFGRTGTLFACEQEAILPDFLCLAKGLTGGYLPLAVTMTTEKVFSAFLGSYEEMKTFFYGHSYCGNALGCTAALASLKIFEEENTLHTLPEKINHLTRCLEELKTTSPFIGEIRQCGMIAGIDLWEDPTTATPFPWQEQTGARVCKAARKHGLLTRPVRDTLVLMPPLCITPEQITHACKALEKGIRETCVSRLSSKT